MSAGNGFDGLKRAGYPHCGPRVRRVRPAARGRWRWRKQWGQSRRPADGGCERVPAVPCRPRVMEVAKLARGCDRRAEARAKGRSRRVRLATRGVPACGWGTWRASARRPYPRAEPRVGRKRRAPARRWGWCPTLCACSTPGAAQTPSPFSIDGEGAWRRAGRELASATQPLGRLLELRIDAAHQVRDRIVDHDVGRDADPVEAAVFGGDDARAGNT